MNCTLEKAASLFRDRENILILSHIRPDGDTLGSAYALKYALCNMGKKAEVVCADEIPKRLMFLAQLGSDDVTRNCENSEQTPFVCAIDVAELHLLGENRERFSDRIDLKLDHHPNGAEYATYNYIDGKAAACGEIIFRLIRRMEEMQLAKLTPAVSTCLYTAIASDTGCFKYSNVTSDTMYIAAELIENGAASYDVCHRLFEVKGRTEIEARKFMYNNSEFYADGRVAVLAITNEFREKSGASDDDIGFLVSELREIEGVELAITIKPDTREAQKFKISMRSGLEISASALCAMFGGGGHERAAGGSICAPDILSAKRTVLDAVLKKI